MKECNCCGKKSLELLTIPVSLGALSRYGLVATEVAEEERVMVAGKEYVNMHFCNECVTSFDDINARFLMLAFEEHELKKRIPTSIVKCPKTKCEFNEKGLCSKREITLTPVESFHGEQLSCWDEKTPQYFQKSIEKQK